MDDTAPHNLDRRSTTRDAMLSDCGNLQSNAKGAPRDLCTQNGRRSPTEELARAREGNLPERMRDVSVSSTLPTGQLDAVKKMASTTISFAFWPETHETEVSKSSNYE